MRTWLLGILMMLVAVCGGFVFRQSLDLGPLETPAGATQDDFVNARSVPAGLSDVPEAVAQPLAPDFEPPPGASPDSPFTQAPGGISYLSGVEQLSGTPTDLEIILEEAQTGRLMIGHGVNSNAGLANSIQIQDAPTSR